MCATQLAVGLLLKTLKYFEVILKNFKLSHMKKIAESSLEYANKFL